MSHDALALPAQFQLHPILVGLHIYQWIRDHEYLFRAVGWGLLGVLLYLLGAILFMKLIVWGRGPKDPRDDD